MSTVRWGVLGCAALAAVAVAGCNAERKQECDKLLGAMKPLEQGTPSADVVDSVSKQIDGIAFKDQTLAIYAKNYKETLTVLSSTLKLKASPSAPDGTDDVIKQKLKQARTDTSDIARWCAE
jgi:hypothetical protein